jgi:Domain of unknown function (DUF4224)
MQAQREPRGVAARSVYVSPDDIFRITKRRRYRAQRAQLDRLGIRYRNAANGEPLVLESDLDPSTRKTANVGPRWDLMSG